MNMFLKYHDVMSTLKGRYQHFDRLYSLYCSLERQITRLETDFGGGYSMKVMILKLE